MAILPGDLKKKQLIEQMIRVDHAGEYGAKQIYLGQLSVLKNSQDQQLLKHMAAQEEVHLDYFTKSIQQRRVRPSILMPIWHVFGYVLGKASASLGKNSAMICTEAVEEVINDHYKEQFAQLKEIDELDLAENIEKFRQEELEHHDIAKANMSNLNLGHKLLYQSIKLGCKISISLAKKF